MRSLVVGLALVSVLAALIVVALLAVRSLESSLTGGLGGDSPSGGSSGSLVVRISGTPGVEFSGNYTTPKGWHNVNGTLGATPTEYELGGEGVAGVNLVTVNVQKQEVGGTLKVEILKNGQVAQSAETSATNNTVSVTYSSS
jgi:hypothetical protein